jgi:hypothetical protein
MGGGGSSGPTQQQQDLQTEQALTNANLNLEENDQRKGILNAMQGTRVFRGSALSRAVAGNSAGGDTPAPGSATPVNQVLTPTPGSLMDLPGQPGNNGGTGVPGLAGGSQGSVEAPTSAAGGVARGGNR